MEWIKVLAVVAMVYGIWAAYRSLGAPVLHEGARYFRQPDGSFRRWYGGRRFSADEVGAPEQA
ncbi:hypothetical protein [Sphingomonas sanguinis]|jgi:hypothetical protein|uniref:Uncharacterized protein n=1 Tax=Sphingomonas sanguinis TaxID=33051 RepID=A0A147JBW8_9SPHN|nr:hypothetical protein [Sphingomonas sanguinis]KTW16944.1 hypothetical protein NS258_02945 [Sphingomonas sanguinis]MBZ6381548.1 hypothetical protein [Sphingomonas sanguinis]NNG51189.1 hypothetical protein [Sphingomonas sanguinis]NNG52865.1 hypothetical protein [Sphingomonas sanguinis]NVP30850.1 hypothetical protein [Sphingomonas sanguinis]